MENQNAAFQGMVAKKDRKSHILALQPLVHATKYWYFFTKKCSDN